MAAAATVASVAPAAACGYGYASSCASGYVSPCASAYGPREGFAECAGFEHLVDPRTQYRYVDRTPKRYYYVTQAPTFAGPGDFAPYQRYWEASAVSYGGHYRHRARGHYYHGHPVLHSRY